MARTWQAHAALCKALDGFLPSSSDHRARLDLVRFEYLEAVRSLERFTAGVASKQRETLLREPSEWLSTPDAKAVEFWIAAYAAFSATLASLSVLSEQLYPLERILTDFEELPDFP